jgi:hypothetical protein
MRKLEPDKDFEFEENYYGESNIIEGFNFIYCNNYTDKLNSSLDDLEKECLSFISCVISLPAEIKVINDLVNFMNTVYEYKFSSIFKYKNIYIKMNPKNIQLFLRGDINFYKSLCDKIHNNIFTKYIRNNIFPNEMSIETPNEYLDKLYNSITNPCKDIDILFIEDNILCEEFKPVIGLSVNQKYSDKINRISWTASNKRIVIYLQINELSDNEVSYLIENVKHGDKLIELLHKHLTDNDYLDIDEVIEE